MQIDKLLNILRNPIGIESTTMKSARLTAANMIEGLIPIPEIKPNFESEDFRLSEPGFQAGDKINVESTLPIDYETVKAAASKHHQDNLAQECLSTTEVRIYETEHKKRKEGIPINPDDFQSAPKNHIQEGKPDMAELPLDLLTNLLCPAYQEGCIKYERNSWRKGFKMSVMMAACLRHLTKFYFMRETYDQETLAKYGIKKHHLGAAIFCIIAMYNDHKNHPHNDDRRKL